jgi:16S rRNA U1498 N3-methylase RsmE
MASQQAQSPPAMAGLSTVTGNAHGIIAHGKSDRIRRAAIRGAQQSSRKICPQLLWISLCEVCKQFI